jgi:hypothetical protein
VKEHGIPEEDYPAAFALWIAEQGVLEVIEGGAD